MTRQRTYLRFGTFSDERNPVHVYTDNKVYSVTLQTYNVNEALSKSDLVRHATPISGSTYYTTHTVRFKCQDYLGKPIVGMNVTAVGVETSLGSTDWVSFLYGVDLNNTPVLNTPMTATTGSDGSVVYVMLESSKYSLHYTNPALGIDETRYYYPKEDSYLEIFWTSIPTLATPTPNPCGVPQYFTDAVENGSYYNLIINYSDCTATTRNMTVYVKNAKTSEVLLNFNVSNPNAFNVTYLVNNTKGTSFHYGVTGKTLSGAQLYQDSLLRINTSRWQANFLQAEDDDATAAWVYNAIAIGLITAFAILFSLVSIKIGVASVPLIGAYFWWIGWLETSYLLVAVAVVFGIFLLLRFAESESDL
jgi:hypothetical protein